MSVALDHCLALIVTLRVIIGRVVENDVGQPDLRARQTQRTQPVEVRGIPDQALIEPFLFQPNIRGQNLILLVLQERLRVRSRSFARLTMSLSCVKAIPKATLTVFEAL